MKTKDAIIYAGGSLRLAQLLGITCGAISQWGDTVPDIRQLQIERVTFGALRSSPGCFDRVLGLDRLTLQPRTLAKRGRPRKAPP